MRFPQVSSSTAMVDPMVFVGSVVNVTPSSFSLAYSACVSATKKLAAGVLCSKIACWYALAAGLSFSPNCNCVPSGSSGETTVSHLNVPFVKSIFLAKPRTPV